MFKKVFMAIFVLLFMVTLAACAGEEVADKTVDPSVEPTVEPTVDPTDELLLIPATAIAAGNFTTLVAALVEANLVSALEAEGPFTVFAPTDEAFTNLLELLDLTAAELLATDELADVLLFHVVAGFFDAAAVIELASDGPVYVETLFGQELKLEVVDGKVYVNDVLVILADVLASNGVIHVVEGVLVPDFDEDLLSIPATATEAGLFTTLVAALVEANLVTALEAEGPFTVFAPTDQAFLDLLATLDMTAAELLALDGLANILLYHVVPGYFDATSVIELASDGPVYVETLLGQELKLEVIEGSVYVNGVLVIMPDLMASNGVIHVVEGVLLPEAEVVQPMWIGYGLTVEQTENEVSITYANTPGAWWNNNAQLAIVDFDETQEMVVFTFTGVAGQTYVFKIEGNGQAREVDVVANGMEQQLVIDLSTMTEAQRSGLNLIVVFSKTEGASGTVVVKGWSYTTVE